MEVVLGPRREHEMTSASRLRRGRDPLHRKLELIDGSLRVLCRVLDGSPGQADTRRQAHHLRAHLGRLAESILHVRGHRQMRRLDDSLRVLQ